MSLLRNKKAIEIIFEVIDENNIVVGDYGVWHYLDALLKVWYKMMLIDDGIIFNYGIII